MTERYAPQMRIPGWGEAGQARLASATVAVIGAGGLGFPVITYLAGAGVGTLLICDGDVVTTSNLHRQLLFGDAQVGLSKSAEAARRVGELNPSVRVVARGFADEEFLRNTVGECDVVLDCTDNFDAKFAIADACAAAGTPLVWGTIVGWRFQVSVWWTGAPDPAQRLTLRDLVPSPPQSSEASATAGVLGPVVGQVGSVMATEACKLLTGLGEPLLGRVLVGDGLRARYEVIELRSAR